MAADQLHIGCRGKRILAQELSGLIDIRLDLKGGRVIASHDKVWDGRAKLKGQRVRRGPQPATSYDNEDNRETKYFKVIKGLSSKKIARPATQLKCLYISTYSLGNKQELEATVLLENRDVVPDTEN